jgi:hypothetical protein
VLNQDSLELKEEIQEQLSKIEQVTEFGTFLDSIIARKNLTRDSIFGKRDKEREKYI